MKLPKGVEVRGNSLRVHFSLKGKKHREPIEYDGDEIIQKHIDYAGNKVATIRSEIKMGTFVYSRHFPSSKHAYEHSGGSSDKTVSEAVDEYVRRYAVTGAASSVAATTARAKCVKKYFKDRALTDVSLSELEDYVTQYMRSEKGYSSKTVNNTLIIIRAIFRTAFYDGIIPFDITTRLKNIETTLVEEHVDASDLSWSDETRSDGLDPFDKSEREQLAHADHSGLEGIFNMILFNVHMGLSKSELLALAWEDVKFERGQIWVRRALVQSEWKVPKEKARVRKIEIMPEALPWLQRQREISRMRRKITVKVRQFDNQTLKAVSLTPVFINETTGDPLNYRKFERHFKRACDRAGVANRAPNQMRHTFASQMLTNFVPLEFIARHMGHTDTTMIKKHYGKWLTDDVPRLADLMKKIGR